ncbi:Fur family transcriptional regulator [Gorillibacterium sp. CAU 1737]|uniref:Fur family transcriptional regulator n=1 Tax=Gorillibacterium sp. CAU 1737 TaxID=3140362 RepID=UPI003261456F
MVTKEEILHCLAEQGYKITEQRKRLAQMLTEADTLTPLQMYQELHLIFPGMSYDTIYRNLKLLEKMGLITRLRLDGGDRYRLYRQSESLEAICLGCGETIRMEELMLPIPVSPERFQVVEVHVELVGYCGQCQGNQTDSPVSDKERRIRWRS